MTTLQYALSYADGEVYGFADCDTIPVLSDGCIAHVMVERVNGWPGSASPTAKLYIANGELYSVETASLDELKAMKTAEITAQRIAADSDKFTYNGLSIRTAEKDMFDLLIADARISKGGMPPNWPGGWKAIENSYVPISTVDEWNAFFIAMYDAGIANFTRSQQIKARIAAATAPEEIAAITWSMNLEVA